MVWNRRHCSSLIHPSMRGCDAWCRGHLPLGRSTDFVTGSRRSRTPCSTISATTPTAIWSPTTLLKSPSKSSPRCWAFLVTRYPSSTHSPTRHQTAHHHGALLADFQTAMVALREFEDYIDAHIERLRRHGGDDSILSAVLQDSDLTDIEVRMFAAVTPWCRIHHHRPCIRQRSRGACRSP